MRENPTNVAIYWDFENLQASLVEKKGGQGAYGRTKYLAQEALVDIESIMEYAATFGVVSINRAYCNWQWYGKYREALLHNGLELIQLFHPGASAKNGGDIKLCLDCTEDLMRFPHVDVVVIVGGDSDFLPVAQKIKALGKTLVGIGTQANTNRHWAHSCHEFKFYEALILDDDGPRSDSAPVPPNPAQEAPASPPQTDPDNVVLSRPEELLRRAILRLSGKSGEGWVLKGAIRPMMKRMDPTFEEEQHGVRSFSAFMKKFENVLEVRAGRNDQEVRLRPRSHATPVAIEPPERFAERAPETPGERRTERIQERHPDFERHGRGRGRDRRDDRFRDREPRPAPALEASVPAANTPSEPERTSLVPDHPLSIPEMPSAPNEVPTSPEAPSPGPGPSASDSESRDLAAPVPALVAAPSTESSPDVDARPKADSAASKRPSRRKTTPTAKSSTEEGAVTEKRKASSAKGSRAKATPPG